MYMQEYDKMQATLKLLAELARGEKEVECLNPCLL